MVDAERLWRSRWGRQAGRELRIALLGHFTHRSGRLRPAIIVIRGRATRSAAESAPGVQDRILQLLVALHLCGEHALEITRRDLFGIHALAQQLIGKQELLASGLLIRLGQLLGLHRRTSGSGSSCRRANSCLGGGLARVDIGLCAGWQCAALHIAGQGLSLTIEISAHFVQLLLSRVWRIAAAEQGHGQWRRRQQQAGVARKLVKQRAEPATAGIDRAAPATRRDNRRVRTRCNRKSPATRAILGTQKSLDRPRLDRHLKHQRPPPVVGSSGIVDVAAADPAPAEPALPAALPAPVAGAVGVIDVVLGGGTAPAADQPARQRRRAAFKPTKERIAACRSCS